jgi:hypothetical protein
MFWKGIIFFKCFKLSCRIRLCSDSFWHMTLLFSFQHAVLSVYNKFKKSCKLIKLRIKYQRWLYSKFQSEPKVSRSTKYHLLTTSLRFNLIFSMKSVHLDHGLVCLKDTCHKTSATTSWTDKIFSLLILQCIKNWKI